MEPKTLEEFIEFGEQQGFIDHQLDDPDATTESLVNLCIDLMNERRQDDKLFFAYNGKVYLVPGQNVRWLKMCQSFIDKLLKGDDKP